MSIRKFSHQQPVIAESAFVDEAAIVIGDVTLGEDSSIWPTAVLRGDVNSIRIGKRTNIQDGTVVHATHPGKYNPSGHTTDIGSEVTIGHRCIIHGCTIADHCLIGMGACLMDGVVVEPQVMVGAGSLVSPGKILTSGYLWLGSPIRRVRLLTGDELEFLTYSADYYVQLKNKYPKP